MLWYAYQDEWLLFEKVVFDGPKKQIIVNADVTTLDIREDVWSAWVRWHGMDNRNNDRFPLAMERKGLEDIPNGQTGDSYFLRNEWVLLVNFSKVAISGVLFSRDFASAYFTYDLKIQFAAQVSAIVNTVNIAGGGNGNAPTVEEIWSYVNRQLTVASGLTAPQEAKIDAIPTNPVLDTDPRLDNVGGLSTAQDTKLMELPSAQENADTLLDTVPTGSVTNSIGDLIKNKILTLFKFKAHR